MCRLVGDCGVLLFILFFFKQKTADGVRISDWSSDVCSSDLQYGRSCVAGEEPAAGVRYLIDMAGVEPGALPHAFTLQLQELGIGVADAGYIGKLGEILGRRIAAALIVHALEIGMASCRE